MIDIIVLVVIVICMLLLAVLIDRFLQWRSEREMRRLLKREREWQRNMWRKIEERLS